MKHNQFVATAAKWALGLSPLVLLGVAVLAFSQDRYSFFLAPTHWHWEDCATPSIVYGNSRARLIEEARQSNLANAPHNQSILTNFDENMQEQIESSPGFGVRYTGGNVVIIAVLAFADAKVVTNAVLETIRNYDQPTIERAINAHFDELHLETESYLRGQTTRCAEETNDFQRRNDRNNGNADRFEISYGTRSLGVNSWMVIPTRTIIRTRTWGYVPSQTDLDELQQENDAG